MEHKKLLQKHKEVFLQKKIIIVGGGIAGLACADRLRQLDFKNVTILEAKDRVGGRVHSVKLGSSILELGAQWIHGQYQNVIYKIADSFDLLDEVAFAYSDAIFCFLNFTQQQREYLLDMAGFFDKKLHELSVEDIPPGTSVLNFLANQFNSYVADQDPSDYDFLREGYQWYCKFLMEINGCQDLSSLSLKLYGKYKECDGAPHVQLSGGYSSFLNILETVISPDWILKNKPVVKIDWSDFTEGCCLPDTWRNIKVYCEDDEIFTADHVIVTIPLGCLKANSQSMFVPGLSANKELAIHSLGFGTVNKIYFQFEEPFWEGHDIFLVFDQHLHVPEDPNELQASVSKLWTKSINRFSYTPGCSNLLCAWVAGEGAALMESLLDDAITEHSMEILETILQRNLPMPNKVLRSSWSSDSYARGSYSHLTIDCEAEGVLPSNLAAPEYAIGYCIEHPVLLFAGEATHDCYFSTVHGAYETGVREAEYLFHHYSHHHIVDEDDKLCLSTMLLNEKTLRNKLQIVIVGAGIAGLTCALHLANSNFTNVTVVEAQDQIGGRVSSVNYNGGFLELGAQWIHGTKNSLYDFSMVNDLLPSVQEIISEGKGLFYTSDGEVIEKNIIEDVEKIVKNAKLQIDNGQYDKQTKKSVKSFLYEAFNSYADVCCDKENLLLKRAIFDWFIKFEVVDNACDDLNSVAIQSFTEWDDCPEELYHITFKNGFTSVIDTLSSQIPNFKLHLNTPVKTVKWNEDFEYKDIKLQNRSNDSFPVVLECNNEIIFADSVIVTASVGFLQENNHRFFLPSLPLDKQKAFSKIGFGTVNKIFLIFKEPFWNSHDLGFHFVWTSDGSGQWKKLCDENPWVYGITGFDVMKQYPNVLLGWIGGNDARLMESVEEKHVSYVCTEMLRKFLNNPHIPDPTKMIRSCWYSNPYIRGSYSNRKPTFYEKETTLSEIQEPLYCGFVVKKERGALEELEWPILLFAGEATDENSFSSAHGAYNSGIKAAENLIRACLEVEVSAGQVTKIDGSDEEIENNDISQVGLAAGTNEID